MIDWILSLLVGVGIGLVFTLVSPVEVASVVGLISFVAVRILFLFSKPE